jgi:hypothetical protein
MYSNQNLAINGAPITSVSTAVFPKERMIEAQQGYFDSSILSSIIDFDPNKGMLLLQTAWDKQVMKKQSFANNIYRKVVTDNAILNVNGRDGGKFKYKVAIETDNCLRTVDDTSDQSVDGYVGGGGSTFRIVLNKKLAPNQVFTMDKGFGDYLVVEDVEVKHLGYGYEHMVHLSGSRDDLNKVYPASYLENDIMYFVASGSYITELSEKLALTHMPETSNYMEAEFKLGSGQGHEHYITGDADSYKLTNGYTTADTQKYLNELASLGINYDETPLAAIRVMQGPTKIETAVDMLEILTMRTYTENFNSSLMFMQAQNISTSKGVLEFNEGLWQQMRRGKIFKYNRKGQFNDSDLVAVRNYVYKYNNSPTEDTFLHLTAGSELGFNIERLIANHAKNQVTFLGAAGLLGSDRVLPVNPVSGSLTSLAVAPIKFSKAHVPGVGMVSVTIDHSLDNINGADRRARGVNPAGKDHTTYSGYIFDVTDQTYSSNATFPEGTKQVGEELAVKHNVYLVRPERGAVIWGRENGRYSSREFSNVRASNKLMGEGFFIYGYGAMWMPDPSKFVTIELRNRLA